MKIFSCVAISLSKVSYSITRDKTMLCWKILTAQEHSGSALITALALLCWQILGFIYVWTFTVLLYGRAISFFFWLLVSDL